jgi:hypothetical protein
MRPFQNLVDRTPKTTHVALKRARRIEIAVRDKGGKAHDRRMHFAAGARTTGLYRKLRQLATIARQSARNLRARGTVTATRRAIPASAGFLHAE